VVSWDYSPCDRLSRWPGWDYTELLHQSQLVDHSPVLAGQPVIAKASDVNEIHGDRLARCRYSHELTLVRPAYSQTGNCLVAAGKRVLNVHPHIRKRGEHYPEILDDAVLCRWESWNFLALDEVIGELPAETVNVTRIDKVVEAVY
jgi:hypothetical protein